MWIKLVAVVSLGSVLVFGAALVSKAKSPTTSSSGSSSGGGSSAVFDPQAVATISTGEEVDLSAHVSDQSEWTIFEFTADW